MEEYNWHHATQGTLIVICSEQLDLTISSFRKVDMVHRSHLLTACQDIVVRPVPIVDA